MISKAESSIRLQRTRDPWADTLRLCRQGHPAQTQGRTSSQQSSRRRQEPCPHRPRYRPQRHQPGTQSGSKPWMSSTCRAALHGDQRPQGKCPPRLSRRRARCVYWGRNSARRRKISNGRKCSPAARLPVVAERAGITALALSGGEAAPDAVACGVLDVGGKSGDVDFDDAWEGAGEGVSDEGVQGCVGG